MVKPTGSMQKLGSRSEASISIVPDQSLPEFLDSHEIMNLKNTVGIKLPPRRRKDAKEKQEFEQNAYDLCLHQTAESWLCCKSFALL